jgi:hypothetical protein
MQIQWTLELKICLLYVLKNDFGTVDEVMFQGVKRHSNSFSASCASKKVTSTVAEVMI